MKLMGFSRRGHVREINEIILICTVQVAPQKQSSGCRGLGFIGLQIHTYETLGCKKKASGQMSGINALSNRKRNRRFKTSMRHFVSGSKNTSNYRKKRRRLHKETQHCRIRNAIFLAWSHSTTCCLNKTTSIGADAKVEPHPI